MLRDRPAHRGGPGAFTHCREPAAWRRRAPRGDSVSRASPRRFSLLASLRSGRGTREQTALLERESLEVGAALKESREQSPDSAPVLLPLAGFAAEE